MAIALYSRRLYTTSTQSAKLSSSYIFFASFGCWLLLTKGCIRCVGGRVHLSSPSLLLQLLQLLMVAFFFYLYYMADGFKSNRMSLNTLVLFFFPFSTRTTMAPCVLLLFLFLSMCICVVSFFCLPLFFFFFYCHVLICRLPAGPTTQLSPPPPSSSLV